MTATLYDFAEARAPALVERPAPAPSRHAAADVQELVEACAARIGRPVNLDDHQYRLLAYSPHPGEVDAVRRRSILDRMPPADVACWLDELGVRRVVGALRIQPPADMDMQPRVCVPVRFEGQLLGFIWLIDAPTAVTDPELEDAIATAAELGALLYGMRLAEHCRRTEQHELVERLLTGSSLDRAPAAAALLAERDLSAACAYTAVLLAPVRDAASSEALLARAERVRRASDPGSMVFAPREHGLVAVVGGNRAAIARAVARLAAEAGANHLIAAGDPVTSLDDVHASYAQARQAAKVAAARERHGVATHWGGIGADRLIVSLVDADVAPPAEFVRLAEHQDGAELIQTLATYLELAGDAQRTASALFLHRSTLYGRLRRIEAIAEIDLRNGDDRLTMQLALHLWTLRGNRL
jgi:sugar diacid utilization regulator